jgi:hypothetical protein
LGYYSYDSVVALKHLTESDLNVLGIEKPGHRKALLLHSQLFEIPVMNTMSTSSTKKIITQNECSLEDETNSNSNSNNNNSNSNSNNKLDHNSEPKAKAHQNVNTTTGTRLKVIRTTRGGMTCFLIPVLFCLFLSLSLFLH